MISALIQTVYLVAFNPFPWAGLGVALLEPAYNFFQSIGL